MFGENEPVYRVGMAIPLTLGVPHRPQPNALVEGLLHPHCADAASVESAPRGLVFGPPTVPASQLLRLPEAANLGRIVVRLDIDPDRLRGGPGRYEAVRFDVDATAEDLADAVALRVPAPLVVFPTFTGVEASEETDIVAHAQRTPGVHVADTARRIADVLAVVSHSDVGLVARAESGEHVLAILAATVASLRGDDIAAALTAPDVGRLARLIPEAAEAVRTVLLGIEIADADGARATLEQAGLIR